MIKFSRKYIKNCYANNKAILTDLLLNKNYRKRLGSKKDFKEIKEHRFFESVNFEKLLKKEVQPPFVPIIKNDLDTSHIDREFTQLLPNQASLIPAKTYNVRDSDFPGFSFPGQLISPPNEPEKF